MIREQGTSEEMGGIGGKAGEERQVSTEQTDIYPIATCCPMSIRMFGVIWKQCF